MPQTLPLIKDPNAIPGDIWNLWFATRNDQGPIVSEWSNTIGEALRSKKLPDDVVERLKTDNVNRQALVNVLSNPHHPELIKPLLQKEFPPSLVYQLRDMPHDAFFGLERHPNIPSDTLQWIHDVYGGGNMATRLLAQQPTTPPKILDELSKEPTYDSYRALSTNPNLPPDVRIRLIGTPYNMSGLEEPKMDLISKSTPEEMDKAMGMADAYHQYGGSNLLQTMLRFYGRLGDKISHNAMDKMVDDPRYRKIFDYSGAVPHELKMTPEQAEKLSHTDSFGAMEWLAQADATPKSVLELLADGKDPLSIAEGSDPGIRARAATRVSPEKAREVWNKYRIPSTFSHPNVNTPPDILKEIVTDPHWSHSGVVERALAHPNLTADDTLEALQSYMQDPRWLETENVQRKNFIAHVFANGKADQRHVEEMIKHPMSWQSESGHLFITPENLVGAASTEQFNRLMEVAHPANKQPLNRAGSETGKTPTPDARVHVSFGTNRLRRVRALAEQNGGAIHESQAGMNLRQMGYGKLVDKNGMVTSDAISKHIDSLPKMEYGITENSYGPSRMQMHDEYKPQQVFQLNATEKHLSEMAHAGVLDTYKESLGQVRGSHPLQPRRGLGWVRYNTGPDGKIHIDEVQSDFHEGSPLYKLATREGKKDKYKKMLKILWGSKNPTDIIHEAFHQHMRDQGRHGTEMHIWHADSKHQNPDLSNLDPKKPLPAHHQNTYRNYPEKMGYESAKYGEAEAQTSRKYVGQPTMKTTLHKAEISAWMIGNGILQKSLPGDMTAQDVIWRFEAPVKIMLGDVWQYPEFRAAQQLAVNKRFDEAEYRKALMLYGDDPLMLAIYAYNLPRTKDTVNSIKSLMEIIQ